MFWVLFLLLAWAGVLLAGVRLLRATTEAAGSAESFAIEHRLSLYEAAYLAGGPDRVAVVTLLSMARGRRLLLAHTGWATVVDPVGRDPHERALLAAFDPQGQSPVRELRAAAAAHGAVRELADRLGSAGLTVPEAVRGDLVEGLRAVRRATWLVLAMAAASLAAAPSDRGTTVTVLWWFSLPLLLTLSCQAVARFEGHRNSPWASPSGRRLLLELLRDAGADGTPDPLTAVAVHGVRAVTDPELRAALA
ncbi:TIGR04222 domain-containing membrane protein [Streptomyces sp. NPDC048383]|uniref:TIGR04222 domain-containing membrane protein n=1 Tax=Streptomyces sp. NPDC048383 TaxID=3155386 RepID=UPI00343C7671